MARRTFGTVEPRFRPHEMAAWKAGERRSKPSPLSYRARYRDPRVKAPQRGPWINAPHTFTTKAEAEAWLTSVKADIDRGAWRHPDEIAAEEAARAEAEARAARLNSWTVKTWGEEWLRRRAADTNTAPGTVRVYVSRLNVHIYPTLGDLPLTGLTAKKVQAWYDALPSRSAQINAYRTLRTMLNAAIDSEETALTTNPCRIKGGDTKNVETTERYLFSPAEVQALADAIDERARALIILLADAGLRINEALALRRCDFTHGQQAAFVDVRHSIVREGSTRTLGPTKTKRTRRVQVSPTTADTLTEHIRRFCDDGDNAPIFPSRPGDKIGMQDNSATRLLDKAMADAGIVIPDDKMGGWHAFRHYSATRFGQAGASTSSLMQRYGWRKPEQAMHYQRADSDYERTVLDRMTQEVDAGAPTWKERSDAIKAAKADNVTALADKRRKQA